jgi:hypothetical protein
MKKVLLLTFIGFSYVTKAQKSIEDETIYTTVGVAPQFSGGSGALSKFICENITIPSEISTDKKLNTVFIKFIVEKDGSIKKPEIVKGINTAFNQEAIRVINLMPQWKAGGMKKYGIWVPLRAYMIILVKFFQNKIDCETSYNQTIREK